MKPRTGAFLNVDVNGVLLVEEEAIGEVDPPEKILITGKVDVSGIITGQGPYEVTLTLIVVNSDRAWLVVTKGRANRSRGISRSTLKCVYQGQVITPVGRASCPTQSPSGATCI